MFHRVHTKRFLCIFSIGSWVAHTENLNQWIMVELDVIHIITDIATQGKFLLKCHIILIDIKNHVQFVKLQ